MMHESLERKNTIIYGGAFNPPTLAHQAILQACIDHAEVIDADVWLLPSGNRTDKLIDTPLERRLQMIQALANDVVRRSVTVAIKQSELERQVPTETYDTAQEFDKTYPDRRFTWVFGSDSVATMAEWHGGESMLDSLTMLIINRPGLPVQTLGRYATMLPAQSINTSSTEVRTRLLQQLPVDDLVSPAMLRFLQVQ